MSNSRDCRKPGITSSANMNEEIRMHYELHPYPHFSYCASVRTCDTYALNVEALWARANRSFPPGSQRILLAGCGSFSPYPTSLANPGARIVALDLSAANLRRARIHSLLHGRRNIDYLQGDLLDENAVPGPFSFIDCYGVLHHLDQPLEGLKALERRLAPGGIMRIMVYSRHARREEESIRRALRLLRVRDVATLCSMTRRAKKGSRFDGYLRSSPEAGHSSGLADALLHPRVTTFTIDALLRLCADAGLEPLFFAHPGAAATVAEEVLRLREAEREGTLSTNFTVYLIRTGSRLLEKSRRGHLLLNPALKSCLGRLQVGTVRIPPKLGMPNPPLDRPARAFLRRFITPQPIDGLSRDDMRKAEVFREAMFLVTLS